VFLISALMTGLEKMEEAKNKAVDDLIMRTRGGPEAGPADWSAVCEALRLSAERKQKKEKER
jgi:hypothetical protein